MPIPSREIGWSEKAKLLWEISKRLERLTQVFYNVNVSPQPPIINITDAMLSEDELFYMESEDELDTYLQLQSL